MAQRMKDIFMISSFSYYKVYTGLNPNVDARLLYLQQIYFVEAAIGLIIENVSIIIQLLK